MCSIFGFNLKEDLEGLKNIGIAGESRGTDATGVSVLNTDGSFDIIKGPVKASNFYWGEIRNGQNFYQGHTRATTQGNEINNQNNHPFISDANDFTLTHNGVIYNDKGLKTKFNLPDTDIETDTYVAVQLMEFFKNKRNGDKLEITDIKNACEELSGSFALSILTNDGRLFLLRHKNPMFVLFNSEDLVYASTLEMVEAMYKTVKKDTETHMNGIAGNIEEDVIYEIDLEELKVINKNKFSTNSYSGYSYYSYDTKYSNNKKKRKKNTKTDDYLTDYNLVDDFEESEKKEIRYDDDSLLYLLEDYIEYYTRGDNSSLNDEYWIYDLETIGDIYSLNDEELERLDDLKVQYLKNS